MPSSNPLHRKWYGLGAWKKRQRQQMLSSPTCVRCAEINVIRPAKIADHVNPHWATYEEFLSFELNSLCQACHTRKLQDEKRGFRTDFDEFGVPRDPRHPAFK
jgi:5-methylcytosine-specific restriction endonuclease McrA